MAEDFFHYVQRNDKYKNVSISAAMTKETFNVRSFPYENLHNVVIDLTLSATQMVEDYFLYAHWVGKYKCVVSIFVTTTKAPSNARQLPNWNTDIWTQYWFDCDDRRANFMRQYANNTNTSDI